MIVKQRFINQNAIPAKAYVAQHLRVISTEVSPRFERGETEWRNLKLTGDSSTSPFGRCSE